MKYRCLFSFTTQKTLGPCFAHADIETDGSMTKPEMKSIEEHYKEVIEKETGCEVSKFTLAAWSEIAEEEKDVKELALAQVDLLLGDVEEV